MGPKKLKEKLFPLTPADYEIVVQRIVDLVARQMNVEKQGCGLTNRIKGWSGCKHQIDATFISNTLKLLLLVECKQWRRKVTLVDVLALHSRISDVARERNHKDFGMLVTTKVHQAGAEKYAAKYDIKTNLAKDNAEFTVVFPKLKNVVNFLLGERQI